MQKIKTRTSKLGRSYKLDGKRGGYRGGGRKQLFKNGKRFHTIIPKPIYDYAKKRGKNNRLAFQALVEDSRRLEVLLSAGDDLLDKQMARVFTQSNYKPL